MNTKVTTTIKKNVIISQEFLKDFEKIKHYNEEYGLMVNNLFDVVRNQILLLNMKLDNLDVESCETNPIYSIIWQTQDLLELINKKVDNDFFVDIERCVYGLDRCLTPKVA